MLSLVAGDQVTGLSRASGGIRQLARSAGDMVVRGCGAGRGRRDRVSITHPPAATAPAASAADSQTATVVALKAGNSVVTTRVPDSISSVPMITDAVIFSQRAFIHGPSTSGSLHSSSRNTLALGSRTPARACTAVVSNPSGASGISTIPAATTTIAA